MGSEEDLTRLFTDYFGDKLSPDQIDKLVADVRSAARDRRSRILVTGQAVAASTQSAQVLRPLFA